MNDSFKLAMQLTLVDMLSAGASAARKKITDLGTAGKEVQRDFDMMTTHITRGLKALSVANYGFEKLKPGVAAASEMQDSLLDVHMSLMRSGKSANTLGDELRQVRATANDLQKITPFSAVDVVGVQKELLNSGLEFGDVIGKGAARAAMMLATITKESAGAASDAMLNIGIPYHLKSDQYGEVADVIQRHVMSGRMKLPHLNAGLVYAAPVTKAFGVPWHDLLTGMAVLGEQGQLGSMAGTHLKDFYSRLTGASRVSRRVMQTVNQDLASKKHAPLEFWDKKGEMLPTQQLIKNLRSSMGNYNTKQRMLILEKIFGEQGGLAALALMSTGTGSWEFIKEKVNQVSSAEEKMNVRLTGFHANVIALSGTLKSTGASLFDPWMQPLTRITQLANDAVDAVGKFAQAHPKVTATAGGVIAAGLAAVAGYGLISIAKGSMAGARVLKGLKGLGGTALGVAEGKMLQAATGVQPVFVTNAAEIASGGSAAGNVIEGMGAAALARKIWGYATNPVAKGATFLPMLLSRGGMIGLSAGLGYGAGTLIERSFINGRWGEALYDRMHPDQFDMRYESARTKSRSKQFEREMNLYVQIDSQGRVISRTDNLEMGINTVKRGAFFEEMLHPTY